MILVLGTTASPRGVHGCCCYAFFAVVAVVFGADFLQQAFDVRTNLPHRRTIVGLGSPPSAQQLLYWLGPFFVNGRSDPLFTNHDLVDFGVVHFEGSLERDHGMEYNRPRVHIRFHVVVLSQVHLRRHIAAGTHTGHVKDLVFRRSRFRDFSAEPEIKELHGGCCIHSVAEQEADIVRLEVPVHNVFPVKILQRRGNLVGNL
mmetsp:Transcript_11330/g.24008  ORF Transcript_11330/g.24008 Transcript_11330/m.24008 type:complete len:202 (+) Transcript_11330:462-1067(+)